MFESRGPFGDTGGTRANAQDRRRRGTRQRRVRVRCVRALVGGQYGWLVRWIDYRQLVWRQSVFVQHEADARDVMKAVRATVHNRR